MAPRLGSRVGYEPIPVSLEVALEFLDPTNGSEVNNFIASVWKPKKAHSKIDRIKIEAEIMIGDDAVKSEKTDKKKVKSLYREASSMEITVSVDRKTWRKEDSHRSFFLFFSQSSRLT